VQAAASTGNGSATAPSRRAPTRRLLVSLLFVVLLALFAAGLWGTVVRAPAYEVRGEIVARAAPDLLLVRHQAVSALGMGAMELMAVRGTPSMLDAARVNPGDRVRLAVRQQGDEIVLVWIEKPR
jgi:Copper binding periplasmic protein CusF